MLNEMTHILQRRTLQKCLHCFRNQRLLGNQQVRTFFNFFRGILSEPEPERKQPLPSYPIVHEVGKVSPVRKFPDDIPQPVWAKTGRPPQKPIYDQYLTLDEQDTMREVARIARKILDLAAKQLKVGVTTDYIDEFVHNTCIEHKVYPSSLNYLGFPKSICTSANNVAVHGVPDDRQLEDGDIINLDLAIFKDGLNADLSETYLIGNVDPAGQRLVHVARMCRDEAIKKCGPNRLISDIGNTIADICKSAGYTVIDIFDGHGIGHHFHCKPFIWHYANNYSETMEPGMAFTIEPVIMEKRDTILRADDDWTMFTKNHARTAQFEHTILITKTGYEVLTAGADETFENRKQTLHSETDDLVNETDWSESSWSFKDNTKGLK